jgi:O-acetyl-ADP-ribose deacetylase (regulator of RNase III)
MSEFKLILCDFSESLCAQWKEAFTMYPEVEIKFGRFEDVDFDCVNSPANSFGLMDGGFDEALAMYFGQEMVDRVQTRIITKYGGEQPVGTSEIVRASPTTDDRIRYVSVTPTMIIPENISGKDNIYMAMKAMLFTVEQHNNKVERFKLGQRINTLVCSGLGTGAGRVSAREAAFEMAKAYTSFKVRPTQIDWEYATLKYNFIKNKTK